MDFFQFLDNTTATSSKSEDHPNGKKKRVTQTRREASKRDTPSDNDKNKAYLKVGQKIRVIYKPGSQLNYYKGYIGEVKYYRSPNNFALVILWAMNSLNQIRMPIDHFMICED